MLFVLLISILLIFNAKQENTKECLEQVEVPVD